MKTIPIDIEQINAFLKMKGEIGLKKETIVEYRRVLMRFRENLFPEFELKPDTLQYWKERMISEKKFSVSSINRSLTIINQFLDFMGERNWQTTCIPAQKKNVDFLKRKEYIRLLQAAKCQNQEQIYFIMKTICILGVSVRELPQITVALVQAGGGMISTDSKSRKTIVPAPFQSELLDYCSREGIKEGHIFFSQRNKDIHRTVIISKMKQLCAFADVKPEKANPRNLLKLYEQMQEELQEKVMHFMRQYYEKLLEAEDLLILGQTDEDWL